MRYLGHLIDFDADPASEYLEFQEMLDTVDQNMTTGMYDPTEVMERVLADPNHSHIASRS